MSYTDLYMYPSRLLPALSGPVSLSQTSKKTLYPLYVPPHGTPSKPHYSPGGRLLLKELTYFPTLMSSYNWPFLPPPTSFFNIQIGCFVRLNWRLIAHTIWRHLFKKTVAFFSTLSRWLRLEIRHWRLLHTAFFVGLWRGRLDYTLTSSEAGGFHGDKPSSHSVLFTPPYISSTQSAHMQLLLGIDTCSNIYEQQVLVMCTNQ